MLDRLRYSVRNREYRFSIHAQDGQDRITQRRISVRDIEDAVLGNRAEIIEDYLDYPRGASCLVLGFTFDERPVHIQFSYPPRVTIIAAYEPDPENWVEFRLRKSEQI